MNSLTANSKANVLGIGVDAVNMEQAVARIAHHLLQRRKGYVCLVGVHGVMEARRDPELARIFAGATLAAPDGMPTVWVGRQQGNPAMERVAGPDLLLEVIGREQFRGFTHFLCGGKEGVAEELRDRLTARYPFAKIVGTYTPPFGPLTPAQQEEFIAAVNGLRPDIVWVGISTPKQERFVDCYLPLLNTTLMFCVGAAFDFHTGRIADCAEWVKLVGLQWLDRLRQDPKHLWKRHLRNNPPFLLGMLLQLSGLRPYPLRPDSQPHATPQPVQLRRRTDTLRAGSSLAKL